MAFSINTSSNMDKRFKPLFLVLLAVIIGWMFMYSKVDTKRAVSYVKSKIVAPGLTLREYSTKSDGEKTLIDGISKKKTTDYFKDIKDQSKKSAEDKGQLVIGWEIPDTVNTTDTTEPPPIEYVLNETQRAGGDEMPEKSTGLVVMIDYANITKKIDEDIVFNVSTLKAWKESREAETEGTAADPAWKPVVSNHTRRSVEFMVSEGYKSSLNQYLYFHPNPMMFAPYLEVNDVQKDTSQILVLLTQTKVTKDIKDDQFLLTIELTNRTTSDVILGCSFRAAMHFNLKSVMYVSLCSCVDHFNGSYGVVCPNPGVPCVDVKVQLLFCHYEAFSYTPRYIPWNNYIVFQDTLCFAPPQHMYRQQQPGNHIVTWSLHEDNSTCNELYVDSMRHDILTGAQTCLCISRYDNIYILGTSHIAIFGDYLMRACSGLDMKDLPTGLRHGTFQHKNINFLVGRFMDQIHGIVERNVSTWLSDNKRIAIWIQSGSWDYTYRSLELAIYDSLPYLRHTLLIILQAMKTHACVVDLYILASPPMPPRFHWNNIAISTFNAKLQLITQELGVNYVDAFSVILPCNADIAQLGTNHNHYLQRNGNHFVGPIGLQFYTGVFLRHVCAVN